MVVEAFLVVSVASFHLSIMTWRSRSKQLVNDLQSRTLYVHRVDHPGFPEMGEFASVVCLDDLREVSEVLLPWQMMKTAKNKTFTITVGKPIPWQTFTDKSKNPTEWAQWLREQSYLLAK